MNISIQRFVELAITTFDGHTTNIAPSEAQQVMVEDKAEIFAHIEILGNNTYKLWCASDWRLNEQSHTKRRLESQERVKEWDKQQRNLEKVAKWLHETSGEQLEVCRNWARQMLNKNPEKLHALLGLEKE